MIGMISLLPFVGGLLIAGERGREVVNRCCWYGDRVVAGESAEGEDKTTGIEGESLLDEF